MVQNDKLELSRMKQITLSEQSECYTHYGVFLSSVHEKGSVSSSIYNTINTISNLKILLFTTSELPKNAKRIEYSKKVRS